MFGKLKEKLKSWTKKVKEELEPEETIEKAPKKEKKRSTKKSGKNPKKEIKEKIEKVGEEPKKKKSFFKKTLSEDKFEELFEELEFALLQNNVALEVIDKIKQELKEKVIDKPLKEADIEESLKEILEDILIEPKINLIQEIKNSKEPYILCFVGINGSGKTTTIAKIAELIKKNKLSVCLAAGDTFRAAAIQQLEEHANKLKIPIIKKDYGVDSASVGFEAISYAKKNNIDAVLIDTAGRLNTSDSLMRELEKMVRVNKPNQTFFVGESTTGNDATNQAKTFSEKINLDGIILTKTDIDEKGGTAISVSYITKLPILYLTTGQTYKDLEPFKKEKILKNLGLN
jgi:fused signal recognition particle receptor